MTLNTSFVIKEQREEATAHTMVPRLLQASQSRLKKRGRPLVEGKKSKAKLQSFNSTPESTMKRKRKAEYSAPPQYEVEDCGSDADEDEDIYSAEKEENSLNSTVKLEKEDNSRVHVAKYEALVPLQFAKGFWILDKGFAEALGIPLNTMTKHLSSLAEVTEENGNIWATCLAISFFQLYLPKLAIEWKLMATKAKTWLSQHPQSENLAKQAQSFLKETTTQ